MRCVIACGLLEVLILSSVHAQNVLFDFDKRTVAFTAAGRCYRFGNYGSSIRNGARFFDTAGKRAGLHPHRLLRELHLPE